MTDWYNVFITADALWSSCQSSIDTSEQDSSAWGNALPLTLTRKSTIFWQRTMASALQAQILICSTAHLKAKPPVHSIRSIEHPSVSPDFFFYWFHLKYLHPWFFLSSVSIQHQLTLHVSVSSCMGFQPSMLWKLKPYFCRIWEMYTCMLLYPSIEGGLTMRSSRWD